MKDLYRDFKDEEQIRALVAFGESTFRARLSDTVNRIADRDDLRLITVSGPSCSGKTTSSAKLETALEAHGYTVHVISIDDFFFDRDFLVERARQRGESTDFDSPDTIDFSALAEAIDRIVSSKPIDIPKLSFQLGRRVGYRTLSPSGRKDVYLIEGIQAVYPDVISCFGQNEFVSLFVCPEVRFSHGRETFDATDVRFLRRLVRDEKFRNASPEFTFTLWENVRKNEETNIFPNLKDVQYTINSYLEYELYMIARYAKPLLRSIDDTSRHAHQAKRYLDLLSSLPEISSSYLPQDSLFREFIG